jgi:hypothetical protein
MFTVFRDSQGLVLERGTAINSSCYSDMLTDRLKPAIQSKLQGLLRKVLCCCTTMPVHILLAARSDKNLQNQKFYVMAHPSHGPNLAPSN